MTSLNHRLFHRISNFKVSNIKSINRIISTPKHSITTTTNPKLLSISNQHLLFNTNNTYYKQLKSSFATKSKDDDDDDSDFDSDESDLSDFSDFSDSDDEDLDTQKKVQSKPKSNNYQYTNTDIPEEDLMKDRIIISNLNYNTNRNDLWELCENYGTVTDVHLPANRNREFQNRGFGFVTFETEKDAANAMENVAGIMFNSRQIRAGFARKDTERETSFKPNQSTQRRDRQFSEFEFTSPSTRNTSMSGNMNAVNGAPQQMNMSQTLNDTTITVNGLPGNVNLAQISKMFGEFGNITNITFSPYQMMGHSFMNAIVSVNLKKAASTMSATQEIAQEGDSEVLSFQNELDIKDRSVEKEEMKTMRRSGTNMTQQTVNKNQMSGVDADALAKEIDELLADSDDEDESDSDSDEDEDENDEEDDDDITSSSSSSDDSDDDEEESSSDDDSDSDDESIQIKKKNKE